MIDAGILDQITQQFIDAFRQDAQAIRSIAHNLFYYLTLIQLTLFGLWMGFRGDTLHYLLGKLAYMMLFYGFFYAGIEYGGQWIPHIINGFVQVGQHAGINAISPSQTLQNGLEISGSIFNAFFNWGVLGHPFVAFVGGVICIAVILIYALLAAELVIVMVKSYILVSLASLFFAFSSAPLTRPMSFLYFKSVIGIGLQLMTLYFLMAVGQTMGHDWASITAQAAKQHQLIPMLMIFATVIVYYLIVKNIPVFVAGLSGVSGFRNYGDEAVSAIVGTSTETASKVSKTLQQSGKLAQGSAQAISGIHKLSYIATQASTGASGYREKVIQGSGAMLKSGARAAANTVKDKLMREDQHLTTGQVFNQHLSNRLMEE